MSSNIYTLETSPNYTLRRIFNRKKLDPIQALAKALKAANPRGQSINDDIEFQAISKIDHPIDLTLRQLAFIAKMTGRNLPRLINEISEGLAPEVTGNWKDKYLLEKSRHKESKEIIGQKNDEIKAFKRQAAIFRNTLYKAGIQDPTL